MLILNLTLSCFHIIVSSVLLIQVCAMFCLFLDTTDNGTGCFICVVELLLPEEDHRKKNKINGFNCCATISLNTVGQSS